MILTGKWQNNPASQRICSMLTEAGFQALFVGGCVRNELLKMPVTDIDIATDAVPQRVLKLAEAAKIRAIPTGIDHGTVTLVCDGKPHEVTTFRKDIATDGRRAVVAFSTDILDDAQRRDFTINALYERPDGTLIDPLNGLPDLLAHRVRFIGDPDQRITEDYLRILRFFRFQAWFGDPVKPIDPVGLAACQRHLAGLNTLSRERVGMEMRKLLAAPDPTTAILAMEKSGVLTAVLPGAEISCVAALMTLERTGNFAPRWQRRLAMLSTTDPEKVLRLSRFEARELTVLGKAFTTHETPRQLAQRFGETTALDATLINCARNRTNPPNDLRQMLQSGASETFPIKAADLAGFIPNGPEIGRVLIDLKERWIAADMTLSRAQLLSDLRRPT